ncbi:MAG: hypothetical protein K0S60_48 [Evtepia sp.]|nr:hypothetical protein [Evtepia sp.]
MSDSVIKLIPYEPFEVDRIEAWLDKLATKGLVLHEITYVFAKFKKSQPTRIRFRIDLGSKSNQSDRRTFLKENGWQYVTILSGRYTVYKTDDPFLTELPSPDDSAPNSSATWYSFSASFIIAITVQLIFRFFNHSPGEIGILDSLLNDTLLGFSLLLIIALLPLCVFKIIAFQKWKRRKESEVVPSGSTSTIGRPAFQAISKVFLPLLIIGMWFGLLFSSQAYNEVPLKDFTGSIPFPLLLEINPEEGVDLSTRINSEEYGTMSLFDNYISKEHRILSPKIIKTGQYGPWIPIGNGQSVSQYSYNVVYYRMLNRQLAKWYAAELSQDVSSTQTISTSGDLQAWYSKTENNQSLILQYETIVIRVWYRGAADLRDCVPLYEAYLGIH